MKRTSPTPADYETAIRAELRAGDMKAVDGLLRAYVIVHPREGIDFYEMLRMAVALRGAP